MGRDFEIVEETDDWAVIEKPSGLLVHPTRPDGPRTLWHGLRELFACELASGGNISIVTRLDRETSGLVLVAKSRKLARELGILTLKRGIEKKYRAIVRAWPEWEELRVDQPVLRQGDVMESRVHLRQMVHASGASATTDFRVLERWKAGGDGTSDEKCFALIEAVLETGRMHQIRVHLAWIGHPVIGDKLYGTDGSDYLEFIETGWTAALEKRLLLARHALHASTLVVPGLGGWESPLPRDMADFIRRGTTAR